MQRSIKVAFTDFWHGNSSTECVANPLYRLISQHYDLELSNNPDFLFYSCFGQKYLKFDCTRVFYTGENIRPDFNQCDYAFGFDYPVTRRNYRLPLYRLYDYFGQLQNKRRNILIPSRLKFCNFVYSNKKATERIEFLNKLIHYKPVDCGGKIMNNIGNRVNDKLEFLKNYKFTIAFENSTHPGYTTEKIMEALIAGTVPIYWGNPLVGNDFNPDCFINCHNFESFDEVIKHIVKVDNDDDLFRKYIAAPVFVNGVDNEFINENNVKRQLDQIFSGSTQSQVAGRYDRMKYWLHPSRPVSFARSLVRKRRRKHRARNKE